MNLYNIGQKVKLSNNPAIVFEIVGLNQDQTYRIEFQCSEEETIHFDNISAEMMRLVDESK